jgi:plastocyanin
MKLYFDEKYELDHIDFHCYFQREHQNDVPERFILTYLKDFECEKRPALAVVIIQYGSGNPENQFHLIPEEITVVLGKNSTVTWINNDDTPSTLTSDSLGWSTGMIKPGESAYVIFNETGVYPYHGEPHPWKIGKVIVLAE